jgi:hypothetical protein
MQLENIIHFNNYPIDNPSFVENCKAELDKDGALVLTNFLSTAAIKQIIREANENKHLAFYSTSNHNVYLKDNDQSFDSNHPRNRQVVSSKGCITDDQIPENSALRTLYDAPAFRDFLAFLFGEQQLHNYADELSSINLHYASEGQELGWHFDESSFAITLLIQPPETGGCFEYIENMRDADAGEMNYDGVEKVLNSELDAKTLSAQAGTLALFRGRNAIHRVTPVEGDTTRILVVLAYNSQPNVALSESARMTFYGRM